MAPRTGRRESDRTGRRVSRDGLSAFGEREAATLYADQFEIYHGNSNPDLARKICRYLGTEPGKRRGLPVRERDDEIKSGLAGGSYRLGWPRRRAAGIESEDDDRAADVTEQEAPPTG